MLIQSAHCPQLYTCPQRHRFRLSTMPHYTQTTRHIQPMPDNSRTSRRTQPLAKTLTPADYSRTSRRTQPRQPRPKLIPCSYRYLGCTTEIYRRSTKQLNTHRQTCSFKPPADMPKPVQNLLSDLTGHCRKHHGFLIASELKHWRRLRIPEVHTDLSVVPDKPVYLDSNLFWSETLPQHEEVSKCMEDALDRATRKNLKKDDPELFEELQKENDGLFEKMKDRSLHTPDAAQGKLSVKPPRNMLHKLHFNLPSQLAKIGIQKSKFEVNVTPSFCITDIHIDAGCDALCIPLSGQKIVLLFGPEPENAAWEMAWYDTWVERLVASVQNPPSCDWFRKIAGELGDPYIANLSKTHGKSLWIPAGWRHIVFTLHASFLGGFTFVPKQHLSSVISQIMQECQAAARWRAKHSSPGKAKDDFLPEELWDELHKNVNAAVHTIMTSLTDNHYGEGAKELLKTLHDYLSQNLPSLLRAEKIAKIIAQCRRLCEEQDRKKRKKDGGKRKHGGKPKNGTKRMRT